MKERPSRQDFQSLQSEYKSIEAELNKKQQQLDELDQKYEELNTAFASSKDLQNELDRKLNIINEQELLIVRLFLSAEFSFRQIYNEMFAR